MFKMFLCASLLSFASSAVNAQEFNQEMSSDPTVVFAEAENKNGGENLDAVVQPKDAVNPLGNPMAVSSEGKTEVYDNGASDVKKQLVSDKNNNINNLAVEENMENVNNSENPHYAPNVNNDFQNTLEDINGRIVDTQSWPDSDIKEMENNTNPETIYSPNVN